VHFRISAVFLRGVAPQGVSYTPVFHSFLKHPTECFGKNQDHSSQKKYNPVPMSAKPMMTSKEA
jgi:hypothetical protein